MDPNSTPAPKPRYFVSAVTPEFQILRKKVDEVLRFVGCESESMEIWGTEGGDPRQVLRDKIDACDGLLQLVGEGYGAELPTSNPGEEQDFGRVSYTQFEFRHAQARGKRTWLLFAGPNVQRDRPIDQLDLPPAGDPDPAGYQAERHELQAAYRASLRASGHLYHDFDSTTELENAVLRLRDDSERLRREFREWQSHFDEGQQGLGKGLRWLIVAAVLAVLASCRGPLLEPPRAAADLRDAPATAHRPRHAEGHGPRPCREQLPCCKGACRDPD